MDAALRALVRALARVEAEELDKVPPRGPLILVVNHINMLEIPILHAQLQPRPLTALAKAESWRNPVVGKLFDLWGIIPIRRGERDMNAYRGALAALSEGKLVAIGPEGTRSHDGVLRRAQGGVASLAVRSGAPLLPVAHHGGEALGRNLRRFRRTPFRVSVGDPFHVALEGARLSREVRRAITDEIMYQLAALLPPTYRGHYADLGRATEQYLRFAPPARSNLQRSRTAGRPG